MIRKITFKEILSEFEISYLHAGCNLKMSFIKVLLPGYSFLTQKI